MLDRLRALAVFAKVADVGSFRGAASALSLSPSVVSHHVAALEEQLGVPLLYRSTRRLALTPDGETLLSAARDMVAAAQRGLDALDGRTSTPAGELRLTAPAFLAETSFGRDLAAFSTAHPKVRLVVSFTDAPRDLLRDGFDLALRMGRLTDSSHKSRRVAEMRRALVAAPRYLEGRQVHDLGALATLDVVHLSSRPPELTLTPPNGKRAVTVAVQPKVSVDSAAAIRELVLAGAGVAALPEVLVRADLSRGRLVELLPRHRLASMAVHAVWPHNAQRPTLTLRFVDFIEPRLQGLFGA